ncbi:putative phage abortive infection protein [Fictibacillus sp. UD]|uniref:putative phage abortive infection protein n=1 Tax=Fictibacillus sp. UD TaxID=3038777 RepID=UPI003744F779
MLKDLSKDLQMKLNSYLPEKVETQLNEEYKGLIEKKKEKGNFIQKYITGKTAIIIVFVFILIMILFIFFQREFMGDNGPVGDFINGVTTPVISLGALIAAVLAYNSQQKQLREQKIQIDKQRIETQFFQLINLHNEIVNSMQCNFVDKDPSDSNLSLAQGRSYFREVYKKLMDLFNEFRDKPEKNRYYLIIQQIDNEEHDQLYHYFRNMYQLFRIIDKNNGLLDEKEQEDYISIIDAQLTYFEKQLLYFNTRYFGSDGFYGILEKYKFFREYGSEKEGSSVLSKFKDDANIRFKDKDKDKDEDKESSSEVLLST